MCEQSGSERDRDQRAEQWVGRVLRAGVVLSAAVVLVGAGPFLTRHMRERPDYAVFHGEPAPLRSVGGILVDAASGKGAAIIQLGILILIATPVARVLLTVLVFLVRRDFVYVLVTLLVFVLLLYGLIGGS